MTDGREGRTERAGQPGRLSVTATVSDGIRVVTAAGEIDYDTCEELQQALEPSGPLPPRVVVDMHQVTFMDSSGINVLLGAYRTHTTAGGWLRLAGPTGAAKRALQLVGLDTVIDCHETLSQALNA
ncbi:anti-anti-sigma factor [Streptomyces sp. WAC 05379]|uniref:STAS domain-containing protein n=1 Tax=Streptomyces TaxID=1883 RepID=UPI000F73CB61|nr:MULTISPECIES: STAS domain-containing protein [unclassified Streptomyces]MBT1094084.1 STAS domain-containing protein [Streptomyces sp. Tu102]RSO02165.1 anti-anti-sigma factor [Streptomyces sp. WAC 05379]